MKGWRLFALVIVGLLMISSGALVASMAIGTTQRDHEISFVASVQYQDMIWSEMRLLDVDTQAILRVERGDNFAWMPDGRDASTLVSLVWSTNREDELYFYHLLNHGYSREAVPVDRLPSGVPVTISMAWSPDGTQLAFLMKTPNILNDLYVYTSATGATQNISQTPQLSEEAFVWSPDGRSIAYTNKKAELWVSALDAEPHKLPITLADPVRKPLWSPDSTSLIVKAVDNKTAGTQITVSDGTQTILPFCASSDDDARYISKLAWHPDGRLTCTMRDKKTRITDIVLVDLTANASTVIGQEQAVVDNLSWSSDGLYLLYQADATILAFNVMAYDDTAHRLTQVIRLEGGKAVWRPAP